MPFSYPNYAYFPSVHQLAIYTKIDVLIFRDANQVDELLEEFEYAFALYQETDDERFINKGVLVWERILREANLSTEPSSIIKSYFYNF